LGGRAARVLDLGCGPGLYTSRLARLGHRCVGIDYSPASIAYARAEADGPACRYELADLREAELGADFDLAMLIFGELNVFPAEQAAALLARARAALAPGGALLLEAHTYAAVREIGQGPPEWRTAASGLFAPTPYLWLSENFWHDERCAATTRHYVIDLASAAVTRYAQSFQAYTEDEYEALLRGCGFAELVFFPALTGGPDPEPPELQVIVARP
jgi:SAM-dependent methyltransferase